MHEHAPNTTRRNAPNGAGRVVRGALLSLFAGALAVVAALVPVCVDFSPANSMVNVHRCEAHATDAQLLATRCLEKMSDVAGLSVGDFVATCSGVIAVSSGMIIATDAGIQLGKSASYNLGNLIDAADYPDYDLLSDEEKSSYGSRENYDAAKFNSLMTAFGLGDYVSGFYNSGGGNFDGTAEQNSLLEHIGAIGQTWINRGSVTLENVKSAFVSKASVQNWAGAGKTNVNANGVDGWPDTIPRDFEIGDGDLFVYSKTTTYTCNIYKLTSFPVYWLNFIYLYNGTYYLRTMAFSKSPFGFNYTFGRDANPPSSISYSASSYTYNGNTYYQWTNSTRSNQSQSNVSSDAPIYCNMPVMPVLTDDSDYNAQVAEDDSNTAIPLILFGADVSTVAVPTISDYPDDSTQLPDDLPTYMPNDGVQPSNTWNYYITQPEAPYVRPENPYNPVDDENPQYQSGTPEWQQETTENLQPALNIEFNKLFPFCMIYDLRMFWDKLKAIAGTGNDGGLSEQARSRYELITVPGIDFPGLRNGITFDLEPVATILHYIRPAIFWFLIVSVVMSVINFWRSILTGG